MNSCLICLDAVEQGEVHDKCSQRLFKARRPPSIDLKQETLHTAALAMIGHTSISGMQGKLSVRLSKDRLVLKVAAEGGDYILKPDTKVLPELPANEHVTMRIAELVKIEVPPLGLVRLADDSLAYIISRFDRTPEGKLRVEDCCQLGQLPPKDLYKGSYEKCAKLVKRYASEPLVELQKLYRQVVFSWWVGNGDMHRKNLSLLTSREGKHVLSPAYDLVNSRLVIPRNEPALNLSGQSEKLTIGSWKKFADYCGIPRRAAMRVIDEVIGEGDRAKQLIAASYLPEGMKETYVEIIDEQTATFG